MFKMSDSASFSSLLALVDNHLSKISTQENSESTTGMSNRLQIPKLSHGHEIRTDQLFSTCQRIGIPSFNDNSTSVTINDVLAQQVSNMLKAKELKRQQEQKLIIETRRNENCVNLLEATEETPYKKYEKAEETLSGASSVESLFDQKFIDFEEEMLTKTSKVSKPVLFCVTDLSYILQQKITSGKCSNFGKVLSSRIRATAAPYLRDTVNTNVVKFDFNTPSPCDLVKERLRKPTSYNTYNFNILDMI